MAEENLNSPRIQQIVEGVLGGRYNNWRPLPDDVVKYNGGQRCDMEIGPCSCGGTHVEDLESIEP